MNDKNIENFAKKIRSALNLSTPIDLEKMVDDLGGEICIFSKHGNIDSYTKPLQCYDLENNMSGNIFQIGIHENCLSTSKRFLIAQELGHLFYI